jgi:undecaprenyl-diphosphatase
VELYEAVVLGVVEGITEYLPISSTGHLIVVSALLGLDDPETKRSVDAFNIVIQGGAILAVLGLYRTRVRQMLAGVIGRDPAGLRLLVNLFVAFIPAAIVGLWLHDAIERRLFHPGPVIAALALGGVAMVFIGRWQRRFFHVAPVDDADPRRFVDLEQLTWRRALLIGLLQCVAMWPGTSRSMMTITGGMVAGLRPRDAAEFSFLLGLPTLGGACVVKSLELLGDDGPDLVGEVGLGALAVGFLTGAVAALLAIRWLVAYLNRHGLALFGWYRIVFSLVLLLLVARGILQF